MNMISHRTKFAIGELVYLVTDADQSPRMITGIMLRPNSASYECSFGIVSSDHYEIELTREPNIVKRLTQ